MLKMSWRKLFNLENITRKEKIYSRKTYTILKNKITHSEKKLNLKKTVRKAWVWCKDINDTKTKRDIETSN